MDLTGARWSLAGAEAVLRLRSLRASDDFDNYWTFHERHEFLRNHASRYADIEVVSKKPIKQDADSEDEAKKSIKIDKR